MTWQASPQAPLEPPAPQAPLEPTQPVIIAGVTAGGKQGQKARDQARIYEKARDQARIYEKTRDQARTPELIFELVFEI